MGDILVDVGKLLKDDNITRLVRYLGAFKVVEGDLGVFDELARVKSFEQFVDTLNKVLRVKDRVIRRLIDGIKGNEYEAPALSEIKEGTVEDKVRKVFDVGEGVIRNVLDLARNNPHLVASIIASLALAYSGVYERR